MFLVANVTKVSDVTAGFMVGVENSYYFTYIIILINKN